MTTWRSGFHTDSGLLILQQVQQRSQARNDICWVFNESGCFRSICKFRHACEMCFGPHTAHNFHSIQGRPQRGNTIWGGDKSGAARRPIGAGAGYRGKAQREVGGNLNMGDWTRVPSLVKLEVLRVRLWDYPNKIDRTYLWDGFTAGFRIPFLGKKIYDMTKNLKSLVGMGYIVKKKMTQELNNRVSRPFNHLQNLWVSLLGLVPKTVPGEYHLIHHLSLPQCSSVTME